MDIQELISNLPYKNKDGSYNRLRESKTEVYEVDDSGIDDINNMISVSDGNAQSEQLSDLDIILRNAVNGGASDIHIIANCPPKARVDGQLVPMNGYPVYDKEGTKKLLEVLLDEETSKFFDQDGDLDFAHQVNGVGRFRVNLYKQRGTWAGVFRKLSTKIPKPQELGLPQSVIALNNLKRGLVLVTGPTGSGKSTTLASIIDLINNSSYRNIITLEDPIEYVHKHKMCNVAQREMGVDSKNFASALRAALREDPDVILVGEMRDYETISTAVTAAETGHLVFSTLHTIGATATIDRIVDTYPSEQQTQARAQLATCFQGIISQQLIPKVNGGRIAAFEVMLGNDAIRSVIREGKTELLGTYIQNGKMEGMCLMDDYIISLLSNGLISPDQALEFSVDKKKFREKIGMN